MSTATATPSRTTRTSDGAVATFFVGEDCFGVDANCVQEVLQNPVLTHVPHAPREIEGLINLRGQVVIVISLRRRLGMDLVADIERHLEVASGSPATAPDHDEDDLDPDASAVPVSQEPTDPESDDICVVLKTPDGPVCILVDKISDVLPAPDELLEPPPETISQEVRDHVIGVHKMDDKLLLVLDVERVIAHSSLQEN